MSERRSIAPKDRRLSSLQRDRFSSSVCFRILVLTRLWTEALDEVVPEPGKVLTDGDKHEVSDPRCGDDILNAEHVGRSSAEDES